VTRSSLEHAARTNPMERAQKRRRVMRHYPLQFERVGRRVRRWRQLAQTRIQEGSRVLRASEWGVSARRPALSNMTAAQWAGHVPQCIAFKDYSTSTK
jgi:hypothetical protein